jgi:hypothetical protein
LYCSIGRVNSWFEFINCLPHRRQPLRAGQLYEQTIVVAPVYPIEAASFTYQPVAPLEGESVTFSAHITPNHAGSPLYKFQTNF